MVFAKKISYFYNSLTQVKYLHMYFSPYNREEEGALNFRNIYFSEKYYHFYVMEEPKGIKSMVEFLATPSFYTLIYSKMKKGTYFPSGLV
jgi:hypothetical protein